MKNITNLISLKAITEARDLCCKNLTITNYGAVELGFKNHQDNSGVGRSQTLVGQTNKILVGQLPLCPLVPTPLMLH